RGRASHGTRRPRASDHPPGRARRRARRPLPRAARGAGRSRRSGLARSRRRPARAAGATDPRGAMSPRDDGGIHPRYETDTGQSTRTGRGRRAGEGPAPADTLNERIDALGRAADALETVTAQSDVQATREVPDRIHRRRTLSADHTVTGLFGATGSGMSSLLNVL